MAINEAVFSRDVDANLFQHGALLAVQNKQRGLNLVQVDKVGVIAPVGLFSRKIKTLGDIKPGDPSPSPTSRWTARAA